MNATIVKFGYPNGVVADYEHWIVLLRPQQPTLGALVLAAKSNVEAFAALEPRAFVELGRVVADIEAALKTAVGYERINYLMLMMVDPHVHFHVLPRYEGTRQACGLSVTDVGWPKAPALGTAETPSSEQAIALGAWLREHWPSA